MRAKENKRPQTPEELAAIGFVTNGFNETKKWWFQKSVRSDADGWPTVFANGNYHCVYCRKNLSLTIEDLVASTTDHVVPQLLFSGTGEKGANHLKNLVPCCSVCNSIKGSWYPSPDSAHWETRKAFINAARSEITRRKEERVKSLEKHIGAAKITIWDPRKDEYEDFI